MRINEEFFDEHKIDAEEMEDETTQDELCRFVLDYYFFKYPSSTAIKPINPENIERQFKTAVNFIRKSPMFSNVSINRLELEIDRDSYDNEYFGMPYKEFRKLLPKTVFGIPVNIEEVYSSNTGLRISSAIGFDASLKPDSPADLYRLFKILLIPNSKAIRVFFRIYPQFVPDENRTKPITWFTPHPAGHLTKKQGDFHEGSYFQLYFDNEPVSAGNFIEFYHMFMDIDMFEKFYEYIKRTGRDNDFAIDGIKTRIGFDELKKQ